YPPVRDPRPLLDYLKAIDRDFKFIIHTQHRDLVMPYMETLGQKLEINKFIARHDLISKMKTMDFLINFDNDTTVHSPSKIIDYSISGRPILSLKSQKVDTVKVDEFLSGNYSKSFKLKDINQYRIENVIDRF